MLDTLATVQVVSASFSVFGACVVLAAMYLAPKWRSRVPPVKWILETLSICNLLAAINLLYYGLFEVGSILYTLVMAIETYALMQAIYRHERLVTPATYKRHALYHSVVIGFCVGTCIWIFISGNYTSLDGWCWIASPEFQIMLGYGPAWASVVGITIVDTVVVIRMIQSARALRAVRSKSIEFASSFGQGGAQLDTYYTMPPDFVISKAPAPAISRIRSDRYFRTIARQNHSPQDTTEETKLHFLFFRLLLYPVILIIFIVPGSVVRLVQLSYDDMDDNSQAHHVDIFAATQRFCDPARGWIVAIVWVFSDIDVCREVMEKLRSSAPWGYLTTLLNYKESTNHTDKSNGVTTNPIQNGLESGVQDKISEKEVDIAPGHALPLTDEEVSRSTNDITYTSEFSKARHTGVSDGSVGSYPDMYS